MQVKINFHKANEALENHNGRIVALVEALRQTDTELRQKLADTETELREVAATIPELESVESLEVCLMTVSPPCPLSLPLCLSVSLCHCVCAILLLASQGPGVGHQHQARQTDRGDCGHEESVPRIGRLAATEGPARAVPERLS